MDRVFCFLATVFQAWRWRRALLLVCCMCCLLPACSGERKKGGARPEKKATVVVSSVISEKKQLPYILEGIGHVEASASVAIRPQVTAVIERIHFQEGENIRKGVLLFTLDARPFLAKLAQAEAALVKARAESDNASREAKRYQAAVRNGYVSAEQTEQAVTRAATLSVAIRAAQAAVDSAKLEVEYCSLRAPISGRAGDLTLDVGNLARANSDPPLVSIHQLSPLTISFTLPGQEAQRLSQAQARAPLQVQLFSPETEMQPLVAELVFIDPIIDPASGVLRVKARYPNQERRLWPGQVVKARVLAGMRQEAVAVPEQALRRGPEGAYLYVVGADERVTRRAVSAGVIEQGRVIIASGLSAGERVVTEGQMQLSEGVQVVERSRGKAVEEPPPGQGKKSPGPSAAEAGRSKS